MRIFSRSRRHGIHLVSAEVSTDELLTDFQLMGEDWLRIQQAREARRLRFAAMAIGAAFAPVVWLGHELLILLNVLH